jgi:acyl homoserine lactone synthase
MTHSHYRTIITNKVENPPLVDALQCFRRRLFVERLGWRLSLKDGRECDEFDTDDAVYVALFKSETLIGGFRAIRTDQDYLAQSVFAGLATLRPFPRRRDTWEISRFGVLEIGTRVEAARINYGVMLRFAQTRKAIALVAVVDLTHERFLSFLGIRTRRYGPPQIIGTTMHGRPMEVVAGEIPIGEQEGRRFRSLMEDVQHVEVTDETLVFGRSRVSA